MDSTGEYMTVKQYADLKQISVQAVYKAIKKGKLKTKKVGYFTLVKPMEDEEETMEITLKIPAGLWNYATRANSLSHEPIEDMEDFLEYKVQEILEKSVPFNYRYALTIKGFESADNVLDEIYTEMKQRPVHGDEIEQYLPLLEIKGKEENLILRSKDKTLYRTDYSRSRGKKTVKKKVIVPAYYFVKDPRTISDNTMALS